MISVLGITGLERHLCIKAMDSKNKKISKILDKYKSSFSSTDLSNLESIISKFFTIRSEIEFSKIECFSKSILILSLVLLFDIKNCKNKTINNKRIII